MAKVRRNILLEGLSGKLGSLLVVRRLPDGQTIVCAAAAPSSKPRSEDQLAGQDRLALATAYSKAVRADATLAAPYLAAARRTGRRPHNLCVAEFLTLPALGALRPSGPPPAPLQLLMPGPVALQSVLVRLAAPDGTVVAEGPAQLQPDPTLWHYTPTPAPAAWAGLTAHVTLTNHPGTSVEVSVLL